MYVYVYVHIQCRGLPQLALQFVRYVHVCMNIHSCVCMYYRFICVYVCIYIHMCVCKYMYIYTYNAVGARNLRYCLFGMCMYVCRMCLFGTYTYIHIQCRGLPQLALLFVWYVCVLYVQCRGLPNFHCCLFHICLYYMCVCVYRMCLFSTYTYIHIQCHGHLQLALLFV